MRWPAVGGTCGRMVAWGACGLRMLAGVRVVPVVLVRVVVVLCAVDGAPAGGGVLLWVLGRWRGLYDW